jgi:hypothetical protein
MPLEVRKLKRSLPEPTVVEILSLSCKFLMNDTQSQAVRDDREQPARRGLGSSTSRIIDSFLLSLVVGLAVLLAGQWNAGDTRPRLDSPIEAHPRSTAVSWTRHSLQLPHQLDPQLLDLLVRPGDKLLPREQEARVTHVQFVDFWQRGQQDILVCDASGNQVVLYERQQDESWKALVLADRLQVPAHATVVDLDQDGDNDVLVSILGDILPSDELIGSVILLENQDGTFKQRTLLDDVRRVADVQPADLDGDGDIDLAVAVFGYARGGILWLENRGEGQFRDHLVLDRPGVIHVPVADYDGDGDLDLATIVSQDEEEVWGLENDGQGNFTPRLLYFTHNFDVGGGGLVKVDLDQDGKMDLLLSQGDNLEFGHGWPQPYHGCVWVRNLGNWNFSADQIGSLGGSYATRAGDMDQDGDLDVVMVSMSNDWTDPKNPTIVWVENEQGKFTRTWTIDTRPVELITLDLADIDGDGRLDLVAGRLRVPITVAPAAAPIAVWTSKGASP